MHLGRGIRNERAESAVMSNIILGLAAIVLGTLLLKAFTRANPQNLARLVQAGVGIILAAIAVFLLVRGQFGGAIFLGSIALALLPNSWRSLLPPGAGGAAPSTGATSRVTTDHLEMELDLASGRMTGRVIKGFFNGRALESLRPVELAHLWQDCRFTDPQSAQLVEAYLDRVHPTWREDLARAEAEAPKGPDGKMSRADAFDILGLKDGASDAEIRRAHRELMLRHHPDRGGSTYLAARINEAKDVALGNG